MVQRTQKSEEDDDKMISAQAPLQQLHSFNSRFSLAWSERAGNATLSQLNIQAAALDPDRYSCFQLSPVASIPPILPIAQLSLIKHEFPRRPLVVERALAPKAAQKLSVNNVVGKRPERGGSPILMERFLSENQDTRESQSRRRRQERSPPQQFSPTLAELVSRAQATRNLVGERFLRSLDQRSCLSPEVELAIKMLDKAPEPLSGARDGEISPPLPLTHRNIQAIEPRRSRERQIRGGASSPTSRRARDPPSVTSRRDRTARNTTRTSSTLRSSSVPSGPAYTGSLQYQSPLSSVKDSFATDLRRTETCPERIPRATSTHSNRREVQFTEVRSLKEVDRPSPIERFTSLSMLQNQTMRAERQLPESEHADLVDEHSQVGWDGSQCSDTSRQGARSPQVKLSQMLTEALFAAEPEEKHEEIIAIQDLAFDRKSLLTMLPQPLKVTKTPESSEGDPRFRFDSYAEHRASQLGSSRSNDAYAGRPTSVPSQSSDHDNSLPAPESFGLGLSHEL